MERVGWEEKLRGVGWSCMWEPVVKEEEALAPLQRTQEEEEEKEEVVVKEKMRASRVRCARPSQDCLHLKVPLLHPTAKCCIQ